jgi:hypothetical protein
MAIRIRGMARGRPNPAPRRCRGLRLVKSEHHRSFGKTLTGQTWDLTR